MELTEAKTILDDVSEKDKVRLDEALERYHCFALDVCINDEERARAAEDRVTFAHLLKVNPDGRPVLSDGAAAEFMSNVSGLPCEWCLAWDEYAFCELHGENYIEKQERLGHV